ncbi:15580_t:CDS:2, partial [Gigaspora rosea]
VSLISSPHLAKIGTRLNITGNNMNKSKVKLALTRQLEWLISSGSQEEKSAAQNNSKPGERIYYFWARIFANKKADFKRK